MVNELLLLNIKNSQTTKSQLGPVGLIDFTSWFSIFTYYFDFKYSEFNLNWCSLNEFQVY